MLRTGYSVVKGEAVKGYSRILMSISEPDEGNIFSEVSLSIKGVM